MMLKRRIYGTFSKWVESPYTYVPLVIGARQVGKTFIIRQVLNDSFENIMEINFVSNPEYCSIFDGSLEVDDLITEISVRVPQVKLVPGKTAIFLDEIQECPNAHTSFKLFVEDGRFRVIASGSLLGICHRHPRSNPVGHMDEIRMYPLDFEEFLWGLGISEEITGKVRSNLTTKTPYSDSILKALEKYYFLYMIVGGMPEAVQTYLQSRNIQEVRDVQKIILVGYRNDITKYSDDSDKDKINACFDSIPVHLSKESKKFSYKVIDEEFVPTFKTYKSAINWMKDAFMVNLCYNLDSPSQPLGEHRVDRQFKMYMGDTGLLTYILV